MRMINNLNIISSSLCSLGAHLGHLQVDAYQSLSYYILGNRSFFIIIDLDKSVYMLKSAIVFFEQMILHYGHAVFCHSSIVHFSLSLKNYLSRIITARNQSFSY
jgi:ribosomal protein S2